MQCSSTSRNKAEVSRNLWSGNRSGVEVSGKKRNGDGGRNLSTRRPKRSLFTAERNVAVNKDARGRHDWGRKRLTEGVFVKTAISTFRVGSITLPLPSAGGGLSSLPLGVI